MTHRKTAGMALLGAGLLASVSMGMAKEPITLKNKDVQIRLINGVDLEIRHKNSEPRIFTPAFTVLFTTETPKKSMRRPDVGFNQEEKVLYKVPTWGREELKKIDPAEHVMDGFDPATDRELEQGRTANYYLAAANETMTARRIRVSDQSIQWIYPDSDTFDLSATITLPTGTGAPELTYTLTPKRKGYYSAGYTGAPQVSPEQMDEMWQPMIWQEKRFPNLPYLTEAFLCPLPTALVTHQGITVGVLADPVHLPFMPLPNSGNSAFGIMVRNNQGMAQPALFAPVLGGPGSLRKAGEAFEFKAHLICRNSSLLETFEALARDEYHFRDYRQNATVTLNKTFENMMNYNMGPYSQFVPELRGCNYATDVPGAVKNITGLHPLSLAIITDSEEVYEQRARPMVEYGFSRERFLFATNPKINRDGTSARLEGPGVPMSDFTSVYAFSQNQMNNYLEQAKAIYNTPINRSLNLTAQLYGDRWQNAMALYRATGEKQYLDAAVKGADEYLRTRVHTRQTDFMDKDSRGMFFWTSYTFQWMELYQLYELTGEKRYLDAARDGARRYAQFTWFNPVVPDEKVTVNVGGKVPRYRSSSKFDDMLVPEETVDAWRVSEIGLTPESSPTCQGHRGIYLTQYAPWMLRIASDANDPFLHDVARSAVIGRYESFPGYHMNAGRTTGHEKADFPLRSLKELNGVTSLHYNHPWPHAAMLMDYMVSEVYYRSNGKLDFPAEYAEGYAYCRSKVYGAAPGTFYDGSEMYLYMPKGLASSDNVQINYLAARGKGSLILILTNQSQRDQSATLILNAQLLGVEAGKEYPVELWSEGQLLSTGTMKRAKVDVNVPAMGLIVLKIGSLDINPDFQDKIFGALPVKWAQDVDRLDFGGGTTALMFNFGPELQSVYSYTKANGEVFKEVAFHYACDGKWQSVTKDSYPFEFTVPVPRDTKEVAYRYEATTVDGKKMVSAEGRLFHRW